jgi:hypothetical protein
MELTFLLDEELLGNVATLLDTERELCAKLLAHLAEIESRKLHLKAGFSSMFQLCVEHHGMSEGQAFRRILAARLARRFPVIYSLVASGALHLSALQLLHEHLTEENHMELLQAASGKRKRDLEVWLARRFPKPDVPPRIRKLPERKAPAPPPAQAADGGAPQPELAVSRSEPARLQPLSEGRFKVEFTASSRLREKLARSLDLMSHANPTRDLATVVERALDVLLEQLEKTRLGALKQTKPSDAKRVSARKSSGIPRAVRREVFERDGEQCTYVAPDGRRCSARAFLELDHIQPRAQGGADEIQNLRVRCSPHNQLWAEEAYGRQHIAMRRHFRQQKSMAKRAGQDGQAPEPAQSEPRSTGEEALATVIAKACRALEGLGFRKSEARKALDEVERECSGLQQPPALQQVLRTALCRLSAPV